MPTLGTFPHGVSWSDVPTSVISPVEAVPGVNVVFGAAPLHLSLSGKAAINKPNLFNTYQDAVEALGFSLNWSAYDICEHMDAQFVEFGMYPVIYVPVNDPEENAKVYGPNTLTLVNGQVDTAETELIAWLIVVAPAGGGSAYVLGTDYLLTLSSTNTWVVTRLATGHIPSDTSQISVSGKKISGTPIDASDIIGGIDISTGARSGLEVIEDVFQTTGLVPGVIVCPAFSHDPSVAAVMEAKCENINGCFACTCLIDVDTSSIKTVQAVSAWKNSNNIVFPRQECLFGKPVLIASDGTQKVYNF